MGRKQLRKIFPKLVSLGMVTALCISSTGMSQVAASEVEATETAETTEETETDGAEGTSDGEETYSYDAEYASERIANNYTKVSANYTLAKYEGDTITYNMENSVKENINVTVADDTMDYEGAAKVLDVKLGDVITLTIEVPQDGQYFMAFDYLSYDDSILPIEMAMQVDGAYPFYECRTLEL